MGATWLSEIHFRCVMLERTRGWSEGIASPFSKWYSLYLGKPTERDGWFVIRGNEIKAAWDSIGVANGIHRKNWCDLTSIIIIRRERNRVRVPAKKEKLIFNTRKRKPSRPWRCSRSFFFVFFFFKVFCSSRNWLRCFRRMSTRTANNTLRHFKVSVACSVASTIRARADYEILNKNETKIGQSLLYLDSVL